MGSPFRKVKLTGLILPYLYVLWWYTNHVSRQSRSYRVFVCSSVVIYHQRLSLSCSTVWPPVCGSNLNAVCCHSWRNSPTSHNYYCQASQTDVSTGWRSSTRRTCRHAVATGRIHSYYSMASIFFRSVTHQTMRRREPWPATVPQICLPLTQELMNIPQATITRLVAYTTVRNANGGHTRYWGCDLVSHVVSLYVHDNSKHCHIMIPYVDNRCMMCPNSVDTNKLVYIFKIKCFGLETVNCLSNVFFFFRSFVRPVVCSFIHSFSHSVVRSFNRSFVYSFVHAFGQSVGLSFGCLVVCSFVCSVGHSFGPSFGQLLGRSFGWSVVRSVVWSFIRSFIRSFRSVICSFIHLFVRLFSRSFGQSVVRSVGRSVSQLVVQSVSRLVICSFIRHSFISFFHLFVRSVS